MRTCSRIFATSLSAMVAVTQINAVAWAARPACFVFALNTVPNPIFSASAGSLTAAEASTSQVLEVLAERRSEASPCPPGLSRINGMCVAQQIASVAPVAAPPAPVIAATPAPKVQAAPAPKAATVAAPAVGSTAPSKDPGYTIQSAEPPESQSQQQIGAWTEAFADRERRPSSRTSTAGIVVGYDRQFNWDDTRVRFGGIGSYTNITTSSATSGSNPRTITLTAKDDPTNLPVPLRPDITSDLTFDNASSTASKTRTSGVGGGVTWSMARGNSYLDGVAKVDFFELNSSSIAAYSAGTFNPQDPPLTIYDGLGTQVEQNIYKADGTSTAYTNLATFQQDAKGCIIVATTSDGTDTSPANQVKALVSKLFSPSTTSKSGTASLAVMTLANTAGFTRDLGYGLTLEPSVGFRYTYSHYYNDDPSLALRDGQVLRLEAGGKLSHLQPIGHGAVWSNSVGLYVYSDVWVDGFVVSTDGSSFKGDQGEVRLRGMLQSKIRFNDGLQLYGEINGRVGHDYQAIGGKLGLRLEW